MHLLCCRDEEESQSVLRTGAARDFWLTNGLHQSKNHRRMVGSLVHLRRVAIRHADRVGARHGEGQGQGHEGRALVMNRTHAEQMHSMRLIHAGCQAGLRELIAIIQKRPAITRRAVWCECYDRTMDGIKQRGYNPTCAP